jgi:hypothetical protein
LLLLSQQHCVEGQEAATGGSKIMVRPSSQARKDASRENLKKALAARILIKLPLKTHCKHGHELAGDNLYINPKGKRECRKCRRKASVNFQERGVIGERTLSRFMTALNEGKTINSIVHGKIGRQGYQRGLKIVDRRLLQNFRIQNPEMDRTIGVLQERNAERARIIGTQCRRIPNNDRPVLPEEFWTEGHHTYEAIRIATDGIPWPSVREEIISDMVEAIYEGTLRVEDAKSRIKEFMTTRNRRERYSVTNRWGNISLDAPAFEDGSGSKYDIIREDQKLWA